MRFNIQYLHARYCVATFEVWDLLIYIAPCNVCKVFNMQPIKIGTPGWTPSPFDKCTWVHLRALHNTRDQRLTVPSEGWSHHGQVFCLKTNRDPNPHWSETPELEYGALNRSASTIVVNVKDDAISSSFYVQVLVIEGLCFSSGRKLVKVVTSMHLQKWRLQGKPNVKKHLKMWIINSIQQQITEVSTLAESFSTAINIK